MLAIPAEPGLEPGREPKPGNLTLDERGERRQAAPSRLLDSG